MKKIQVISIISFLIFAITQAKANPYVLKDSVGLERKNNATYVLHKVDPKETLSSIAKKYGVTLNEVVAANPSIEKNQISIGQLVRVPVQKVNLALSVKPQKTAIITHVVKKGETLFSISQKYDVEEAKLKSFNKLSSNTLYPNQALLVEVLVKEEDPKPIVVNTSSSVDVPATGTGGDESCTERMRGESE